MKRILMLVMISVLAACVYQQQGEMFDMGAVNELQPGISTEQDAMDKLGEPVSVTTKDDGSKMLQWKYVYGTGIGIGGGAHAAIIFGPDGKMVRVAHLSKN